MTLSQKSQETLATVHADMQAVVNAVEAEVPDGWQLIVDAGNRTAEDEMAIWLKCHNLDGTPNGKPHLTGCNGYDIGRHTPNGAIGTGVSNHQGGLAVDILVELHGEIVWDGENPVYAQLNRFMQAAGARLNIGIVWGGDFPPPSKPDWDHWELVRSFYPV